MPLRNRLLLIYLLFTSVMLCGQQPLYQEFENINPGPGASMAGCFVQDGEGLVWIGSDKGLFSYDGYTTQQHFTYGRRENTRIYCGVAVGPYLYLGSDNGLLIYNYKTDTYEDPADSFPRDIRAMALQDNSTLWIGTLNGLYSLTLETGQLKHYDRETYPALSHPTIYAILPTAAGDVYIGTYDGLCRYQPSQDNFVRISLPPGTHRSNQFVNSLLEDPARGCIWVGTEGELYKYIPATGSMEAVAGLHDNSVKSLATDSEGRLLAGTDNGLYVYHETMPLQHVVHDARNEQSLPNNIIWSIFRDSDQNIWLGTDYKASLWRHNHSFGYIPIARLTGTGDGNHFHSIFKDSGGNYWFGGTNGLICIDRFMEKSQSATWYKMGDVRHPLPHNRVRHIHEDRDNQLWVATDGSINLYDPIKQQFRHFAITDSTGVYNANWAYNLFDDEEGKLWIATCLGGIFVVDKARLLASPGGTYKAEYNFNTSNGLPGMFVNQIIPDDQGNIWVLLYNNGLCKIDRVTRQVTPVNIDEYTAGNSISFLLCDTNGRLWAGFRGGVVRIDPARDTFETVRLDMFSDNDVLSMIQVNNFIQVSTTEGVWAINSETLEVRSLNIPNKAFACQYYESGEGRVLLGGVDGFAIISPEIAEENDYGHPPQVTAMYVNNNLFTPTEGTNPQSIRYAQAVELDYDQNQLSFEISDLPYAQQKKSKFLYRLSGVDEGWNLLPPGDNRIYYSNLGFGHYRLFVGKPSVTGRILPDVYQLDIRIRPPWYYTWWAKTIYWLLALCLLAWMINFFRVKQKLRLERIEHENRLQQSQAKIDFLTDLSHDLETSLNDMKVNALITRKLEEEMKARARLEQLTTPKPVEAVSQDEKLLARATQVIEKRLDDPDLNVNSLADSLGVNSKQLYRKMKQLTGKTPVEFIKTTRMNQAALLLKQQKFTVAEVMYRVGYSNHSYFSKSFQSEFGKTPRQYMEEAEGGE